jgi:small subunit ribosomal protein S8
MVTDPIADLITRLKNAQVVGNTSVTVDASKLKESILELLFKEGYLKSAPKKKKNNTLEVELLPLDAEKAIKGVQRISKPSRRMYIKSDAIRPFRNGYGRTVISTPKGLLTDKEASKAGVGGEVLFKIW